MTPQQSQSKFRKIINLDDIQIQIATYDQQDPSASRIQKGPSRSPTTGVGGI
jgi:hypothetical protein